ncbi:hypothetical protein BH09DEP1_BH09DEP1_5760 [soil metagenome]
MKSFYTFIILIGLNTITLSAQQKCEQLPGYDLCKLPDLKHILTTKYTIFTDALTNGVDSEKLSEWNKVVNSIGAYIIKNHPELNKEYNQLRAISDGLVNTVKIVKNTKSYGDMDKTVKAFFQNKELFKKSPEDTLATLRKDLAPGTFSRHAETRELLVDFAQALRNAINLVKADALSRGFLK